MLQCAKIFWVTDGGLYSSPSQVLDKIVIPALRSPGSELYVEPFRWDQKLFVLNLVNEGDFKRPNSMPTVLNFCREMNGQVFTVKNTAQLRQTVENCNAASSRTPHPVPPQVPVCFVEGINVNFEFIDRTHFRDFC